MGGVEGGLSEPPQDPPLKAKVQSPTVNWVRR